MPKKLIEVALPLDAINTACEREKSIRHGHPFSLHLWWARRPLAATRAVVWASLVDDPSEHSDLFPTEAEQTKERERLFKILSDLVVWENSNNDMVLNQAKTEIMKYTNENPPALLDPFAGGGAIPLEAQRLGLDVHANDLNPVAVMINKALIEIPPRFAGMSPVNPKDNQIPQAGWKGAAGLAKDVEYYGDLLKEEAFKRIGHLYPRVKVPREQGGGEATVIAWIWTRTGKCENPVCRKEIPFASSFILSKKKNHEAWVEPLYDDNDKLSFKVHKGVCPKDKETSKMGRGALFKCPICGKVTQDSYVKELGKKKQIGSKLMAIVAEYGKERIYVEPSEEQEMISMVCMPENYPSGEIATNPRWFSPPAFGMEDFKDLFSNRQLTALITFSDLVDEVRKKIETDALSSDLPQDKLPLNQNGCGARAYSEAICVYLSFLIDQMANQSATVSGWNNINQQMICVFSRQAIPMVWDYAECNLFSKSTGSFYSLHSRMIKAFDLLGQGTPGIVEQQDAQSNCAYKNMLISTDPPYYDNIGYADLSDYFYIWMRRTLINVYPDLFSTMLVPKSEELIATPQRHDGSTDKAKYFFENGMLNVCKLFSAYADKDYPITIYYAYKQNDKNINGSLSTGWETMLNAIVSSGLSITGTWPLRTETVAKLKARVNALASSIVLVCRKRDENAPICTRRDFVNSLKRELKPALEKLQQSNIAPVDLAQSAIGPGMAVFSRYQKVLEADGTPMSVRSALQIINQELDLYFNGQDSSIDNDSRFCVELFSQCAYNPIKFGDADILARAKGTSVAQVAGKGVIYAAKGEVHLLERDDLPEKVNQNEHNIWLLTQQLTRAMERGGIQECAKIVAPMLGIQVEEAKNLAYRLYSICERKNWAQEAYAYNALVVAWPEIQSKAAEMKSIEPTQLTLDDLGFKTD